MNKIRFNIERSYVGGSTDAAYVREDENPLEVIVQEVINDISTDLDVTIGGVTMFLAAWQDPDHWSTNWAEKLGLDSIDDVDDAVAQLLAAGIEKE